MRSQACLSVFSGLVIQTRNEALHGGLWHIVLEPEVFQQCALVHDCLQRLWSGWPISCFLKIHSRGCLLLLASAALKAAQPEQVLACTQQFALRRTWS